MQGWNQVRHAVALAHTVPGIALEVECPGGRVHVDLGSDAGPSPCEFRRMLLEPCVVRERLGFRLGSVAGVRPTPSGVWMLEAPPDLRRWAVTCELCPAAVESALGVCAEQAVGEGADAASLRLVRVTCHHDRALAVTVVCFEAPVDACRVLGFGVVDRLAAAIYTAELLPAA